MTVWDRTGETSLCRDVGRHHPAPEGRTSGHTVAVQIPCRCSPKYAPCSNGLQSSEANVLSTTKEAPRECAISARSKVSHFHKRVGYRLAVEDLGVVSQGGAHFVRVVYVHKSGLNASPGQFCTKKVCVPRTALWLRQRDPRAHQTQIEEVIAAMPGESHRLPQSSRLATASSIDRSRISLPRVDVPGFLPS